MLTVKERKHFKSVCTTNCYGHNTRVHGALSKALFRTGIHVAVYRRYVFYIEMNQLSIQHYLQPLRQYTTLTMHAVSPLQSPWISNSGECNSRVYDTANCPLELAKRENETC
jgi:hypothetical protein